MGNDSTNDAWLSQTADEPQGHDDNGPCDLKKELHPETALSSKMGIIPDNKKTSKENASEQNYG